MGHSFDSEICDGRITLRVESADNKHVITARNGTALLNRARVDLLSISQRKQFAQSLKLNALDEATVAQELIEISAKVPASQPKTELAINDLGIPDIELWEGPVNGAEVLNAIVERINAYCSLPL